jgi:hypothetical protein
MKENLEYNLVRAKERSLNRPNLGGKSACYMKSHFNQLYYER